MNIIFITIGLILLPIVWLLYTRLQLVKKTNTKGTSLLTLFTKRRNVFPAIRNCIKEQDIREGFMHAWFGPRLVLLAVDPEATKFVLKSPQIQKSGFNNVPYVFNNFGKHLVAVNGQDWKRQRAYVSSGFNSQAYETYFPIFVKMTEKVISKIEDSVGKDIDIHNLFSSFALDLLGNSIFHYDFKRLDPDFKSEYYEAYHNIFSFQGTVAGALMSFIPSLDKLPLPQVKNVHDNVDKLRDFFDKIIAERKDKKYGDILDNLLAGTENTNSTVGLSQYELHSTIFIFFVAGHETTASALTSACNCLRIYPLIQEKLFAEISEHLGTEVPTLEDLDKLPYLNQFIDEVLRLHSPVTVLPTRVTTEDMQYKDTFIPKGTLIGINITAVHENPNYWNNPDAFDPDRFSPENKKNRVKFAYLPFSLGPRQCIGNVFSLIEQKLVLTRLLQKFRVVAPKTARPFAITERLAFVGGTPVHVAFERR